MAVNTNDTKLKNKGHPPFIVYDNTDGCPFYILKLFRT